MDGQDHLRAKGKTTPSWAAAAPAGKHLTTNAYENTSQSRSGGARLQARDAVEVRCGRVFAN